MKWILTLTVVAASLHAAGSEAADAAEHRDLDAVRKLAAQHANLSAPQPDGTTALHWAAHWNDAAMVKALLAGGANAKAANRYGATPLSEAAVTGNASIVAALLQAGADPRTLTTRDGETVLMTAARGGYLDLVNALG